MHDPMTLAHTIPAPWKRRGYRPSLVDIWHVDPEHSGSDDSCDWFGSKRPLNGREKALASAIWDAERVFGNAPYYPDTDAWEAYNRIRQAQFSWRERVGFRWHPRWHVHHWRIVIPALRDALRWLTNPCTICGERIRPSHAVISDWGGDRLRHYACDKPQWGGESRIA